MEPDAIFAGIATFSFFIGIIVVLRGKFNV